MTRPRVVVRRLDREVDTEAAFAALFATAPYAVWLDSALVVPSRSRFSYLGAPAGPLGEVFTHRVEGPNDEHGTVFERLAARLAEVRLDPGDRPEVPFDFIGGYVGYFGYELKAECDGAAAHQAETPDAVWVFVDRLLVVDHQDRRTYLVALAPADVADPDDQAERWLAATRRTLEQLPADPVPPAAEVRPVRAPAFDRDRSRYLADVRECLRLLREGESYEVCLTVTTRFDLAEGTAFDLYRRLRRTNPAPFGAYLKLGEVTVLSSSPERFLRVGADRTVRTSPIKGTAARHADPAEDRARAAALRADPKSRAENLMIVDLLRNDLGRVCEPGSVDVPELMAVQSYATVHQLVSTVTGRLRADVGALECVQACFPGGSMTGAPKHRTMEILDELEGRARGVYAGALGYLGLDGTVDLSIVIRAAVGIGRSFAVGAGGAVVLDSDPAGEYDEMRLKAAAVLRALDAPRD